MSADYLAGNGVMPDGSSAYVRAELDPDTLTYAQVRHGWIRLAGNVVPQIPWDRRIRFEWRNHHGEGLKWVAVQEEYA